MDIAHFTPVKRSRIILKEEVKKGICDRIMKILFSSPQDSHEVTKKIITKNRAIQCEFSDEDEEDPWGQYVHLD
mgnify:FL=1|jgi:hypothetical protein